VKALIVSTYFAPELAGNAPYVAAVAEHLVNTGNDVTVLAGFPHYPEWQAHDRRRPWMLDQWRGAELIRRVHFVPRSPSAVPRALYEASLLAGGFVAANLMRRRPDVVLAFSPSLADGVTGLVAARHFGCPLAVVFQDLMGVGAMESGVRGGSWVAGFVSRVEAAVARRADEVGYVSAGFEPWLARVGVPSAMRLFNWSQLIQPTRTRDEVRLAFGWDSRTICVHGGNMGEKQGLDVVLAAAQRSPETLFVLAGDGNQRARLERHARHDRLGNVQFLGPLCDEDYANVLRAADVLLLSQRDSVRSMSLPSKLATYEATGLPIVAAVAADSETAAVLRSYPNARVVTAGEPDLLIDAITQLAGSAVNSATVTVTREMALEGYLTLLEKAAGSRTALGARRISGGRVVPTAEEPSG
jgi:colanic acid biosynthesis glycosyl transferase WcaI